MGITQDPDTLNYMIVMLKLPSGSLRNNLLIYKYNLNDKYNSLGLISTQLEAVHKLDLIHRDLHNGNILCIDYSTALISDLGLCKPVNQPNKKGIYGYFLI